MSEFIEVKTINSFTDYKIVANGSVLSNKHKNPRWLKPAKNGSGYLFVTLRKDGKSHIKSIHRLVAMAFIHNPLGLPEVNHKDCDKSNNVVSNLEWVTSSENKQHAHDNFRWDRQAHSDRMRGKGNSFYGKQHNIYALEKNREYHSKKVKCIETGKEYPSMLDAAKSLGMVSGGPIKKQIQRLQKTAFGFHWVFLKREIDDNIKGETR